MSALKSKFITLITTWFLTCTMVASASELDIQQALKPYQGKVIYLDFWASWCGPCRKSFPWMNEISDKYADQGFVVVSVNLDAEKKNALAFLEETPAKFTVLYNPSGSEAKKLKVKGMPYSFLIDRQGKIVSSHAGFYKKKIAKYQKEIEAILSQPTK